MNYVSIRFLCILLALLLVEKAVVVIYLFLLVSDLIADRAKIYFMLELSQLSKSNCIALPPASY